MSELVEVNPAWRRKGGLALVCEKCTHERFAEDLPEKAGDPKLEIRHWLKDRLKEDGHWGDVRATGTTCLDVCAKGRVTVLLAPIGRDGAPRCIVADPLDDDDRERLYTAIVDELAPKRT